MRRTSTKDIDTSNYSIGKTYKWNEFKGTGAAKQYYTAGITNKGLDPEMLNESGLVAKTPHHPTQTINNVVYDLDYVLEHFSEVLTKLNIIENGKLNKAKMEWLFTQIGNYSENYATREADKALRTQAEEMASRFPSGGDAEAWYNVLVANLNKPSVEGTLESTGNALLSNTTDNTKNKKAVTQKEVQPTSK